MAIVPTSLIDPTRYTIVGPPRPSGAQNFYTAESLTEAEAHVREIGAGAVVPPSFPDASLFAGESSFETTISAPPTVSRLLETRVLPHDVPVRGYVRVDAVKPLPGGALVVVETYHQHPGDVLRFTVRTLLFGQYDIQLSEIANGVVVNGLRAKHTMVVSYSELNHFLQTHMAHRPDVAVTPGTKLAVHAFWQTNHQWGAPWVERRGGGAFFAP